IDEAKRVDAKPFHEAKRPRDRSVGHDPERHVHALRIQRDEIPEIIVRGLRLREPAVGLLLGGVDDVGKFDRVLNKENGDVVSDEIPVALLGIELDRKPAHITRQIGRTFTARYGGESHEGRGLFPGPLKQVGACDVSKRFVVLEIAVGAKTPCVNYALGDALVVEMKNLLAKMEVLKGSRPARADSQRVL